ERAWRRELPELSCAVEGARRLRRLPLLPSAVAGAADWSPVSARLIGRTGATAGTDFRLAGVATIGASSDNEIRIVAPGVSRRHARILVENDQYFVEDAGATNGTFLNGGRVQREALRHLDVITLGR